jgi:hypothetical protein
VAYAYGLITVLVLLAFNSCSIIKHKTVLGTLVYVSRSESGLCKRGQVKIQPMNNIGSETINIDFEDMSAEKEEMFKKHLGQKIEISMVEDRKMFSCDTAKVQVLAKTGE